MAAMTKAEAQRILGEVPQDKVFWVNDGKVIKKLSGNGIVHLQDD